MEKLHISGGRVFDGDISISGSKNACLPVLAATLLSADQIDISNLPELVDVSTMLKLIKELAGKCYELDGSVFKHKGRRNPEQKSLLRFSRVRTMRASFWCLAHSWLVVVTLKYRCLGMCNRFEACRSASQGVRGNGCQDRGERGLRNCQDSRRFARSFLDKPTVEERKI